MADPGNPGRRQLVVAPQRRAPTISLLTAADFVNSDDEHWLNGIKYRREPCGLASAAPVGCKTSDGSEVSPTQNVSADRHAGATDAFAVWVEERCSTFGWAANEYVDRAKRLLTVSEAYRVEHEFWTGTQAKVGIAAGVDYPADQWLAQATTAVTLNSGTVTDVANGLGLLQAALGDCSGGSPGMIHMPPAVLPSLLSLMLVTPTSDRELTHLLDARGNRIVPGFGYSANTGPTAVAAPAGQYWMYATGMVTIRRTEPIVVPDRFDQAIVKVTGDFTNDLAFRVERYYLTDFDRCCHFAVLVDGCDLCSS